MLLTDRLSAPVGHLLVQAFRAGRLVEAWEGENLIVVGSQSIHAHLLGGASGSNSVTTIGFGTSGAATAFGNTTLTGAYTKPIDAVSYPAANQVAFAFSLGAGESNPLAIFEFGLITGGGTLYARKIRTAALAKDADIALSGTWTISF